MNDRVFEQGPGDTPMDVDSTIIHQGRTDCAIMNNTLQFGGNAYQPINYSAQHSLTGPTMEMTSQPWHSNQARQSSTPLQATEANQIIAQRNCHEKLLHELLQNVSFLNNLEALQSEVLSKAEHEKLKQLVKNVEAVVSTESCDEHDMEALCNEVRNFINSTNAKVNFVENLACQYIGRGQNNDLQKILRGNDIVYAFFFNYKKVEEEKQNWNLFVQLLHCQSKTWECVVVWSFFP